LVFRAHPFPGHVQTTAIYFPQLGSVYPPSWTLLWCVHFWFCLGLFYYCSKEFHLNCLCFAFLGLSACPCLHFI
jgi:hypothetical protein